MELPIFILNNTISFIKYFRHDISSYAEPVRVRDAIFRWSKSPMGWSKVTQICRRQYFGNVKHVRCEVRARGECVYDCIKV